MKTLLKTLIVSSLGLSMLLTSQMIYAKTDSIVLGMGCFWGAEKRMASIPGVVDVESGYAGGDFKNPSYNSIIKHETRVIAGKTEQRNHAEVVKVRFDDDKVDLKTILIKFWENHNPTQGNRQGNDIGSNYRSAIYYTNEKQKKLALETRDVYQSALSESGFPRITTEIARLKNYNPAEEYHQDYLKKNPNGYCGLGGTKVAYPGAGNSNKKMIAEKLVADELNFARQLIVFEAENCPFCKKFQEDILGKWKSDVAIVNTLDTEPPRGWDLKKALFATPTIVLFEKGMEVSRYTGYNGEMERFWKWLGFQLLTPEQQKIAFKDGTERAFTGSHLDETRPGRYVDPITGETLFRSDTKFKSGTGWPSFFNPIDGSITLHKDNAYGMKRTEVRSASSGIHLGHVFDDGPAPTYKRYCINGNVLKFIPDSEERDIE